MNQVVVKPFVLVGISIRTTNKNSQANIDCGKLWQKFKVENYANKIPGKQNDNIITVYYDYEGDYSDSYSYFIGCNVHQHIEVPNGMQALLIPGGSYELYKATGKMPDCIAQAWKEIWSSSSNRAYQYDYEVYDQSLDWNNAAVNIYISVT